MCWRWRMRRQKTARLSCRLDAGLKDWLLYYSELRGVTITALIEDFVRNLQRVHDEQKPEVRQL